MPSEGRQSWHYDTPSSPHLQQDQATASGDYGPDGPLEYGQRRRRFRRSRSTFQGLRAVLEQRTQPPIPPRPQYRQETTGRTDQRADFNGVYRGKRTTRPRDLPGSGPKVSPMYGTRSQRSLHPTRHGPGIMHDSPLLFFTVGQL
jgi:hypothetical protein